MIGIIDCDAFYFSCLAIFNPRLHNSPCVVISGKRGIVLAKNNLAKKLGVKTGDPAFKLDESKFNIVTVDFNLVMTLSNRVAKIVKEHSPVCRRYSVDELFIDLSGIEDVHSFCDNLIKKIKQILKINVTMGVARSKTLAKAACKLAKDFEQETKFHILNTKRKEMELLKRLPVESIWGIGAGRARALNLIGIKTGLELVNYSNDKKLLSSLTKIGLQIRDELQGCPIYQVDEAREVKKEISSTRTFSYDVYDLSVIKKSISQHIAEATEELRSQGSVCRELTVMFWTNSFNENITQHKVVKKIKLNYSTSDTLRLISEALPVIEKNYKWGVGYKKSGVKLTSLQDNFEYTLDLFQRSDSTEEKLRMLVLDTINWKHGNKSIISMSCI